MHRKYLWSKSLISCFVNIIYYMLRKCPSPTYCGYDKCNPLVYTLGLCLCLLCAPFSLLFIPSLQAHLLSRLFSSLFPPLLVSFGLHCRCQRNILLAHTHSTNWCSANSNTSIRKCFGDNGWCSRAVFKLFGISEIQGRLVSFLFLYSALNVTNPTYRLA